MGTDHERENPGAGNRGHSQPAARCKQTPFRLQRTCPHPPFHRFLPRPAAHRRRSPVPVVLRHPLAGLGWPPGRALEPGAKQVLHLRRDLLAPGLHPALGAADHLRLRPVLHHGVRRPRLVRLHLPAERLDLDVHVVRAGHRRRPQPAHQAGRGPLERRQAVAPYGQARPLAGHQPGHGHHLRRLLHPGARTGDRPGHLAGRRHGAVLGDLLHRRHLYKCRLDARAGVHPHVSLCALPERDVRQGHPDRFLRRRPWRIPRAAQEG
ncbi:hypothetical protein FQZ97_820280 [compost metagenome]